MTKANKRSQAPIWKPIAAAPLDGTKILVCTKRNYELELCVASFRYLNSWEPFYKAHTWQDWRDNTGECLNPSHWMELPPPPVDD